MFANIKNVRTFTAMPIPAEKYMAKGVKFAVPDSDCDRESAIDAGSETTIEYQFSGFNEQSMSKSKRTEIRIEPKDFKKIKEFADAAGLSVSEYIRRMALKIK